MLTTLLFLLTIVIGYLVGSICSAVIVCRLSNLPDPRLEGSKNPGATNVLRLAGKQYAAIVLLTDMLKGLIPVIIAKFLGGGPTILGFTALACVVGHMYPVFFDFKGGKGVATAMGALLGFHFILGVVVIATWLVVVNFSRYSSLASIVSMLLAPFYSIFAVGGLSAFIPISIITLLVLYKHLDNITRLLDGKESKIVLSNVADTSPAVAPLKKKATKTTVAKKTVAKKAPTKTTEKKATTKTTTRTAKPAAKKTTTKKTATVKTPTTPKATKEKPKKTTSPKKPASKKTS